MLGLCIKPFSIDPEVANDPHQALRALASAAGGYLAEFDRLVAQNELPNRSALVTRVRGTGPGVSFGSLVAAVQAGFPPVWSCPFEGSSKVSGAALPIGPVLDEQRDDGFLFLRFAPGTRDLPLHIHPDSDRFIFAIGGRGFFHLTDESLETVASSRVLHMPVRDRDALMFRRGVVHTFSTADHPLMLLSYHRPFVPLEEPGQYTCSNPPLTAVDFLRGCNSRVTFDAAWTLIGSSNVLSEESTSRLSSFALD